MSLHRREQKVALQMEIRGLSWPPRVVRSYGTGTALLQSDPQLLSSATAESNTEAV